MAKEVENDAMAQSVEGVVAMVENNYDDLVVGL